MRCLRQLLHACSVYGDELASTSAYGISCTSQQWLNPRGLHNDASSQAESFSSLSAQALDQACSASSASFAVSGLDAASSYEQLAMFFSPTQLGVQLLEAVHGSTGFPWWASIPATAFAVRALLSPLSLKAKAASANIVLLHHSFNQAKLISKDMKPVDAASLGRMQLVKQVYALLRKRHGTPSLKWYWMNAAVQVSVL